MHQGLSEGVSAGALAGLSQFSLSWLYFTNINPATTDLATHARYLMAKYYYVVLLSHCSLLLSALYPLFFVLGKPYFLQN